MDRGLSLEEVSKEYPITLLDTSALLEKLSLTLKGSITEKISHVEEEIDSAIFFREFLESGGNFYVTPNILEEYLSRTNYPYKKKIKKNGGNIQRENLILMRKIRENSKKEKKVGKFIRRARKNF